MSGKIGSFSISGFRSPGARKEFIVHYKEAMKLSLRPKEILDVSTSFGVVRVYRYAGPPGDREVPVVLLHGHFASSLMWQVNLKKLLEKHPVYTLDMLGEPGMSIQTAPIRASREQARWLEEVFRKLGLQRISLVGASLGGWMAMNYLRFYPRRVAAVILLDPVRVFSQVSMKTILILVRFLWNREKALDFLLSGKRFDKTHPLAKTVLLGMDQFMFRGPIPGMIRPEDLRRVDCPVLAIMAGKSPLHDVDKALARGRSCVKGIEMESWEEAGHAFSFEESGKITKRILDFLGKVMG